MVQSQSLLFRGILGLMWVLPVLVNSMPNGFCISLETLRDQLNSSLRRRYMKQNFPINYTVAVHYEEVFRLHNISRLMSADEDVEVRDLRDVWLMVAQSNLKRILRVLPERHPTRRKYLANLESLFRIFEQKYAAEKPKEERVLPESIQDIWDRLDDPDYQGWRYVTPKSLLDNCYRTLHCLFKECFLKDGEPHDYCNIHHWRRKMGTGTTPQPT